MDHKRLVIIDVSNLDAFGKEFGYKVGDELYSFNNRLLTLENAQEVIGDFMSKTKVGDELKIEVYRKDRRGRSKIKELEGKVKKVKITENNIIDIIKDATDKQLIARTSWLGIK